MRKVPSFRGGAAAAVPELSIHLSTTTSTNSTIYAPPPSSCDARKCPWWPYTNSKEFKASTALIVLVLICALICALAFNSAVRYLIRLHSAGRRIEQKAESGGAEEMAEVPAMIYAEGMKLAGEETECMICLSDFTAGERIRVMDKCNHGFHLECVQRWLASRSSCPTCRTNCASE